MPTVHRFDGLRVIVYPSDHLPAHVHVIGGGREVIFDLNCPNGPLEERECHGFTRKQASRIRTALADVLEWLCASWSRIHG